MKFFKYIDGEIQLDREEIALYKLPNKILRRDRGSEGDADGRKKLQAFREFKYVYFVADHTAYPIANGLSEKEAHTYAIDQCGLDKSYTPDIDLIDFIKEYKEEHWSQAKNHAYNLRRILRMNQILTGKIQDKVEILMEGSLSDDQINILVNYQTKLLDIATNLPKQIKLLTETLKTIEEEENSDMVIGRGGFVVSPSMEPGNSIEDDD